MCHDSIMCTRILKRVLKRCSRGRLYSVDKFVISACSFLLKIGHDFQAVNNLYTMGVNVFVCVRVCVCVIECAYVCV